MMHGVTTRLPRIAHETIQYKGRTIPTHVRTSPSLVDSYIQKIANTI